MKLKVLYFDLQTTGGGGGFHEIIQIGAKYKNQRGWEQYILPDREITPKATEIHGMFKCDGKLYNKRQNPLAACAPNVGYQRFIDYLIEIQGSNDVTVVLCAHNCKSFDADGMNDFLYNCIFIPVIEIF